jgi:hypothetical protein
LICCAKPGLTVALYALYIKHVTCKIRKNKNGKKYIKKERKKKKKHLTLDKYCSQWLTRNTRPLFREGALRDKTATFRQN